MPRARTVLTPKVETAPKTAPERAPWNPKPGRAFRCRPTDADPWGGFSPSRYTDDIEEARRWELENTANGIASIVERGIPGAWTPVP